VHAIALKIRPGSSERQFGEAALNLQVKAPRMIALNFLSLKTAKSACPYAFCADMNNLRRFYFTLFAMDL
jgi:hypothetical protein